MPDPVVVPFWDRPYLQIAPGLEALLLDGVDDPAVRELPVGVGSVEPSRIDYRLRRCAG